ncbi:MAG: beta-ketoacyl-[acyl-carrier-protein] synthase family protein, partial [Planctomycetota bacterium]
SPERVAVAFGAGGAGLLEVQPFFEARERSRRMPLRHHFGEMQCGMGRWVAWHLGFSGPRACPSTACSSSLTAIGVAAGWIRRGIADAAVAGGAESLSPLTYSGFNTIQALAPEPCSPFSAHRRGMSLGEGGAALFLEERDRALARGARILAEIRAFATSADAHHMTAPHPEGAGAAQVIRECLEQAGLPPEAIGLVDAHGTGTAANDSAECAAIRDVFGPHAEGLPVVSHKSGVGHCLGAAGAVECAIAVAALTEDTVPPNLRIEEPDPEFEPVAFPSRSRPGAGLENVLTDSFAFGGSNAALILGRGEEA